MDIRTLHLFNIRDIGFHQQEKAPMGGHRE